MTCNQNNSTNRHYLETQKWWTKVYFLNLKVSYGGNIS